MKVIFSILALLALLAAGALIEARAADRCNWVVLTVASKHLSPKPGKDYNEENWGLGREDCLGRVLGVELRGAAGWYRNSDRIDSFYFGGSATLAERGPFKFALAGMLVSGYEIDALTAVFPVLAVEGERAGLNVSYFPRAKNTGNVLGLQAKWRFR